MRITSMSFNPYQTKIQQAKNSGTQKKENISQDNSLQSTPAATYESTKKVQSSATESLTKQQKAENFKDYILNKYKDYGLTFSSGLTSPKRGIAPSFSIDPKLIEQAANDPQKAKELDTLIHDITKVSQNLFNATNHPPEVIVSSSVHIQADGTIVSMRSTEYRSLEAKNKYGGFDFNSFLDNQEELLKKNPSSFDYNEAIGADVSETHYQNSLEIRHLNDEWLKQFREELENQELVENKINQKHFIEELQQKKFFDMKI